MNPARRQPSPQPRAKMLRIVVDRSSVFDLSERERWQSYERRKAVIAATSTSAQEYDARLAEMAEELGL